jgi:large subunit ribosomal protein L9
MKVILLKGVPKLGKPEDVIEVNEGYARNALFPQKLAVPATPGALAILKQKQEGRAAQKAEQRGLLDAAIKSLQGSALVYSIPANEQGNLFSKLDAKDISKFLFDQHRVSIDAKCISIPGGFIKKTGEYEITIEDGSYRSTVSVTVSAAK